MFINTIVHRTNSLVNTFVQKPLVKFTKMFNFTKDYIVYNTMYIALKRLFTFNVVAH